MNPRFLSQETWIMELPFTELRKDKDQVGFERTVFGNQKGKNRECDFDMLIGGTF